MRYLTNESTDPHYNMAFDNYCLENLPLDEPVFYLWSNQPSVIVGLNQNVYSEVNLEYIRSKGVKLARRVSGGGAVYHDLNNLNYTIMGRTSALEEYSPDYMTLIVDALRMLGADAELSGRNDIMVDGCKVSGYAKRMWKDRIMIHGTLMFDVDLETLRKSLDVPGSKLNRSLGVESVKSRVSNLKDVLPHIHNVRELASFLHDILSKGDCEFPLTDGDKEAICSLADTKFATWEWNYAHSPKASVSRKSKFSCGTIEASMDIINGRISGLHFNGDYLGNLPSETIAAGLEGLECRGDVITLALDSMNVGACFDGLSASELMRLIVP